MFEVSIPEDYSYDEEHDSDEVTLVPHVLNVHSDLLTQSLHCPQKERLWENIEHR